VYAAEELSNKGGPTMGRVLVEATIENLADVWGAQRGNLPLENVRRITVPDALVDTGASWLSLPSRLIRQLGLVKRYTKRVCNTTGKYDADVYGTVRLTIAGRDGPSDVMEVSDETPVLIGQIPLEYLDFVVDLASRRLTGNPRHGGEHVIELYPQIPPSATPK
jgi:predicted aspartyl protease